MIILSMNADHLLAFITEPFWSNPEINILATKNLSKGPNFTISAFIYLFNFFALLNLTNIQTSEVFTSA